MVYSAVAMEGTHHGQSEQSLFLSTIFHKFYGKQRTENGKQINNSIQFNSAEKAEKGREK